MRPGRARAVMLGLTTGAGLGAILGALPALAQAPVQPPPTAAPQPQAAPQGEEPPPAAAPPPSAIVSQPTPPVPESEIAPPPQIAPRPRPQQAEKAPPPAPKRALYNAAVLQALDKVTTETLRFEAQLNKPVRYKGLIFTVHTCQVEPDGVRPPAEAHVEIISQPQAAPGRVAPLPARVVYRGWMFADAPGVHPFEHPVYDVWLIACKTASPVNAGSR